MINHSSHLFLSEGLYDVTLTLIHHQSSMSHWNLGHSAALCIFLFILTSSI